MTKQQQKFYILNNIEKEWDFLRDRIKIQESMWKNFKKPTHSQDIKEDKQWAKDLQKLVSLYTKLHIEILKLREKSAKERKIA
jgi:hypothetical protein